MQLKVKKLFSKDLQIDIIADGDTLEECMFQVSPIFNAPTKCGLCPSVNITIEAKVAKKDGELYQYISYLCRECGAKQTWGQYKAPKGCYYLKEWTPKYVSNNRGGE